MSRPHATVKIKCTPDDFRVEELSSVRFGASGPFALYRLAKSGLGTMEAVERVKRRWDIAQKRVSYGGLKDRHARTEQFLTIHGGPRADLELDNVLVRYLGQTPHPFTPHAIDGNRFTLVVRALSREAVARAAPALDAIARDGVPNYFDNQRFGSVGTGDGFVAAAWIKGDFEHALRLALATPHPFDRAAQRELKRTLLDHWGDWPACKEKLPRSHERSIVTYLCDHPTDFRRAFARLRQHLRSLYLAAFQSHLWNEMLALWIRTICAPANITELPLRFGPVPFWTTLPAGIEEKVRTARLPLPSARVRGGDPEALRIMDAALGVRGLAARDLRIRHPKDNFFSKGERTVAVVPMHLAHAADADELYPDRVKLTLAFDLPRGAYATMLVKRLSPALERSVELDGEDGE